MNKLKPNDLVIKEIKNLINEKGYIYALLMILFEDFHIDPEKLHKIDASQRLSVKEASLLLGFLIQKKFDPSIPESLQTFIKYKNNTYKLLGELHSSFMIPFMDQLCRIKERRNEIHDFRIEEKNFFGKGEMLTEPIFYSGTGVYDIQYLDLLERKYKYDKEWLLKKKNFDLEKAKDIVIRIKEILLEKSKRVLLVGLKENLPQIIQEAKKKYPNEDWDRYAIDILPMMELYQFIGLFSENPKIEEDFHLNLINEYSLKFFYNELMELFVIRKSDFHDQVGINSFFENFSFSQKENLNQQFQAVGNFNLINSKPIIQIDDERYIVPSSFLVFEAVYESPFYWMWKEDKYYRNQLSINRGKVGEEIAFDYLSKVFGKNRTFKAVKIITKEGQDVTDIDVLCLLGSKALCVQVKSKKLTELARMGNDDQLKKDFQGAVQDAYNQGLISRKKILQRSANFFNESGQKINLSEDIDEVFIMGITTENYPSLTHQAYILLDKENDDPYPIFSTIFDLELIAYYLNDPYDFLYYIKQRTTLMDYFKADEEIVYLGYHLDQKLWKIPKSDYVVLNTDFGQMIDRNYYPFKAGLEISDDGDRIKSRWKNDDFDHLCDQLKSINQPKITDIIFQLLDYSGDARKDLVDYIIKTKQRTSRDGKQHNFSMPPDDSCSPRVGVTYLSLNYDSTDELRKRLLALSQARKYKNQADIWIGLGSLNSSNEMVDIVVFSDHKWVYDAELESLSKYMLEGKGQGQQIRTQKKINRNDKCPCNSGLKYKNCCGSGIK